MANNTYELVKSEIKSIPISVEQLNELKDSFEDEINSIRLLSHIQNLSDLIDALERRDVINEDNIEALIKIAEIVSDYRLIDKLKNYQYLSRKQTKQTYKNEYAMHRLREEMEEHMRIGSSYYQKPVEVNEYIPTKSVQNNPFNTDKFSGATKSYIYKLISSEIGRNWRHFGRELKIKQGELDELDLNYPRDLKTRVIKMLELFEEPDREDPKEHVMMICNALEECRRKDLSKKIQEILTR